MKDKLINERKKIEQLVSYMSEQDAMLILDEIEQEKMKDTKKDNKENKQYKHIYIPYKEI